MRVWVCTDHDSHYVGGASVVVAETEKEAGKILDAALYNKGLDALKPYTLVELDLSHGNAVVLHDGNY